MYFYTYNHNTFASINSLNRPFVQIDETQAEKEKGILYFVTQMPPEISRRSYSVTLPSLMLLDREDLRVINKVHLNTLGGSSIPDWLKYKTLAGKVTALNINYPSWEDVLRRAMPFQLPSSPRKWRVNITGLGDVGGTLVTGLRLMGSEHVKSVGIYDRDPARIKRWELEANQVNDPFNLEHPEIIPIKEEDFFNCDMFVFCVSIGVPEVGREPADVRLAQFEGNSKILSYYAREARKANFKGLFIVVSDPVDLLCKVAFNESNKDESGVLDFKGLAPEQVRGYGLGVMHSRACYYAGRSENTLHYLKEGRAFGPHGEGVVIANSIENYDEALTDYLSVKTKEANLEVRSYGFKPYIAPALSSGTLSLLAAIKGDYHYSATFIGGVFMGSRNRLTEAGIELEAFDMPDALYQRLNRTYNLLKELYF